MAKFVKDFFNFNKGEVLKLHFRLTDGLFLFEKNVIQDERGLFQRIFCIEELGDFWGDRKVCQINRSINTNIGTMRGLHYQNPPFCEMKFIQCTYGKVYDIAVDLRIDSETYLRAFCYELSRENNLCVLIPEGFAHGFQVMEPNSELLYFHSAPFKKESEGGVNYLDPLFNIKLPFPVTDISTRDQSFKNIDKFFKGIKL